MTIKEVEERTGLARSHIRFYEKEGLISPARNLQNGYKVYSEEDVETLKTIAFFRTLEIPLDMIRKILHQEVSLREALEGQFNLLGTRIADLEAARRLCERILDSEERDIRTFSIDRYVDDLPEYWQQNEGRLKRDVIGFVYKWGSGRTWIVLTGICTLLAFCAFFFLPEEIPIQWSGAEVSNLASSLWIFMYPAACVLIRLLLKPIIARWLRKYVLAIDDILSYIVNFLCFVALSVEAFTVCYAFGLISQVAIVIVLDAVVFIGLLLVAMKNGIGAARMQQAA